MWDWSREYTRIKLCEFETLDAAYEASQMGVDALGFHAFRQHDLNERVARFREIFRWLPPQVERVLLTDFDRPQVEELLRELTVDSIQLYPDWPAEELARLRIVARPIRVIKVVSAQPHENFTPDYGEFFGQYDGGVDGYLLDSFRAGGTGRAADWQQCAAIVRQAHLPIFLAGGLTADNVTEAIRTVQPFGVDVETGVSARMPGGPLVKNMEKCRRFVHAVVRVDRARARFAGTLGSRWLDTALASQ